MEDLIICVAPCPGERQDEKFPGGLDIVDQTVLSYQGGASVVHLHVRDDNGLQTRDVRPFQVRLDKIRKTCPIIVEVSTGGVPEHTLAERCGAFLVRGAELGTLNLGSINMGEGVFKNTIADIHFYANGLREHHVKPVLVIYDLSHFRYIEELAKAQLIAAPYIFNFVFDFPNALRYEERYIEWFIGEIPEKSVWFLTRYHSHGKNDFLKALELGGHVRVGYEDGPFLASGERAMSNAELVEEIARMGKAMGRKVVGPERAREILGISRVAENVSGATG